MKRAILLENFTRTGDRPPLSLRVRSPRVLLHTHEACLNALAGRELNWKKSAGARSHARTAHTSDLIARARGP